MGCRARQFGPSGMVCSFLVFCSVAAQISFLLHHWLIHRFLLYNRIHKGAVWGTLSRLQTPQCKVTMKRKVGTTPKERHSVFTCKFVWFRGVFCDWIIINLAV